MNKNITLEECYEAIHTYDNVITREGIRENITSRFNKIRRVDGTNPGVGGTTDMSYKPYKEWMSLTPEQRKVIHKAIEEAQAKGIKNWNQKKDEVENKIESKLNDGTNGNKNKKRPRRVALQDDDDNKGENEGDKE